MSETPNETPTNEPPREPPREPWPIRAEIERKALLIQIEELKAQLRMSYPEHYALNEELRAENARQLSDLETVSGLAEEQAAQLTEAAALLDAMAQNLETPARLELFAN